MKKAIIIFTLFCTAACVTPAPFTPGKPVIIEGGYFSRKFMQDGKAINPLHLVGKLKAENDPIINNLTNKDLIKEKAKWSEIWFYTGAVFAGVGGYMLGYNLASSSVSSNTRSTNLLVSAALIAAAFGIGSASDSLMVESTELYNKSLSGKKGSKIKWDFNLACRADAILPTLSYQF